MATAIAIDTPRRRTKVSTRSVVKTESEWDERFLEGVRAMLYAGEERFARMRAILDRPMPLAIEEDGCQCQGCARQKRIAFACGECGYSGVPFVRACHCFNTNLNGDLESADMCPAGQRSHCGHGEPECPVCVGADSNWTREADSKHAWWIIRDLRAVLSGGLQASTEALEPSPRDALPIEGDPRERVTRRLLNAVKLNSAVETERAIERILDDVYGPRPLVS